MAPSSAMNMSDGVVGFAVVALYRPSVSSREAHERHDLLPSGTLDRDGPVLEIDPVGQPSGRSQTVPLVPAESRVGRAPTPRPRQVDVVAHALASSPGNV